MPDAVERAPDLLPLVDGLGVGVYHNHLVIQPLNVVIQSLHVFINYRQGDQRLGSFGWRMQSNVHPISSPWFRVVGSLHERT